MSALGLKIIDEAVQSANLWINEVDERTGWQNKQRAYRLMRSALHAIRDHLSVDEAAQLAAQLPTLVRGIYYEGWNPSKTPVKARTREAFLEGIQADFATDPLAEPEEALSAVFDLLDRHVSRGEMLQVRGTFTADIRKLFWD